MKIPPGTVFRDFDQKGSKRFKIGTIDEAKKYCEPGKFLIFWKADSEEHLFGRVDEIEKRDNPRGVYIIAEIGFRFVEWVNVHFGFISKGERIDTSGANEILKYLEPVFNDFKNSIEVLKKSAESIGKKIIFQDGSGSDDTIHDYYINFEYYRLKISVKNEGFSPEIIVETSGKKRVKHIPFHIATTDINDIRKVIMKYVKIFGGLLKKEVAKAKKLKRDAKKLERIQKKEAKESKKALKAAGRLQKKNSRI